MHTPDGEFFAFYSNSKLDLDTDGVKIAGINYDSTHQNQTSIDPNGRWLNSNNVNFIVIPGGFSDRHGGVGVKTLATVIYNGHVAHCVIADVGPRSKFGEGSIALHRALGFERIHGNHIVDCGIDNGVEILIYIGATIPRIPCTQKDIDDACTPYWNKFKNKS